MVVLAYYALTAETAALPGLVAPIVSRSPDKYTCVFDNHVYHN